MTKFSDLKESLDQDLLTLEKAIAKAKKALDDVSSALACVKGYPDTIKNLEKDLIAKEVLKYPSKKSVRKV